MAGAMFVQQCGVSRSAACRAQQRHSTPAAWSHSPSLSKSTRATAGTLLSRPLVRLTGGMRTDNTPARRSAVLASSRDLDRQAQDTGRRVEGGAQEAKGRAQETGRKFESGAQEAKEKAPRQAEEASQEAKGTASRAGTFNTLHTTFASLPIMLCKAIEWVLENCHDLSGLYP